MTVDLHTGEVVESLSPVDARALTDRIRGGLSVAYDGLVEAWAGRADLALGYESWEAYCAGEFTEGRMVRLDREQRREIVGTMRDAGMSTRAIGSAIGVNHDTVADDIKATPVGNPTPAPVTGTDGKTYTPTTRPPAPTPVTAPVVVLTPEQQERRDSDAEADEEHRRQLVETHLLCEHVVVIAQSLDLDLGHYYTRELVIPGRAVTRQVISDAIAALEQLALVWKERELP